MTTINAWVRTLPAYWPPFDCDNNRVERAIAAKIRKGRHCPGIGYGYGDEPLPAGSGWSRVSTGLLDPKACRDRQVNEADGLSVRDDPYRVIREQQKRAEQAALRAEKKKEREEMERARKDWEREYKLIKQREREEQKRREEEWDRAERVELLAAFRRLGYHVDPNAELRVLAEMWRDLERDGMV